MKRYSNDNTGFSMDTSSIHSTSTYTPLHTPLPTPLPPPPPFNMSKTMKLPIFKGMGSEDTKKFWFYVNAVWKVQQITDENIKKAQLVTTL